MPGYDRSAICGMVPVGAAAVAFAVGRRPLSVEPAGAVSEGANRTSPAIMEGSR